MGKPAARRGDGVTGTDSHLVVTPNGPPTFLPHRFSGRIGGSLSTSVFIDAQPAAVVGSTADNSPPHKPTPPGTSFNSEPTNKGTLEQGSTTVFFEGKAATRQGDPVLTCNDPKDQARGKIDSGSTTVFIG